MPRIQEPPIFKSELQAALLGLVYLNEDRPWMARELAERLGASPVAIHRELHRALDGGLIRRESVGRTFLYRPESSSPIYEPLRLLLERTVGVEAELRRALDGVPGVKAAFVHGSHAKGGPVRPTSDVDVLVLGDVDPRLLRRRLRAVENRVGREIDALAYKPDEFAALVRKGNSFARGIVRGPVIPVVGAEEMLPSA